MFGLVAVAVVAIFTVVFGSVVIMQEVQDRRRERDEIASVIAELRQYYQRQNQLRLEAEQDERDEEIFDRVYGPRMPSQATVVPEWQGHRGFGGRRTAA